MKVVNNRKGNVLHDGALQTKESVDCSDNYFPFYQPIIEVSSGKVAGHEALARTRNQNGDIVSAGALFVDSVIPTNEKILIDRYLRNRAITRFSQYNDFEFLTLNISPGWIDLLEVNQISPTIRMIEQAGINPGQIVIEITEQNGNLENIKRLTQEYHQAGIRVAIDDFGAGYSQIDRIIEVEPEFIKIDMKLFKAACKGGVAANVALTLADFSNRSGSKIIFEGVETEEELHFAIDCGADYAQGWLFNTAVAKPDKSDIYYEQVSELKKSYLARKKQRITFLAKENKLVSEKVLELCQYLRAATVEGAGIKKSLISALTRLGVLRYYICDSEGTQISANYEMQKGVDVVKLNKQHIGYNWCHRPYFPLLHAMNDLDTDHLVVSTPYKDIVSAQLCKTYGVFISSAKVLLIDVLVADETLY